MHDRDCPAGYHVSEGPVLVFGGSSGIGQACLRLLRKRGCQVFAVGRRQPPEVESRHWFELDLLDERAVGAWIASKATQEMSLGGILYAAGVEEVESPRVYDGEIWKRTMRVNLEAPAQITEGLVDRIVDGGAIVFIGSIAAVTGSKVSPSYAASKAGLEAFSRSVHLRHSLRGVRCNVLRAGPTRTPLFYALAQASGESAMEERLINDADEVAEGALFLLDTKGVAGSILTVDQGRSGNR
jgi:NAD(P)-dependent dehydrogenase (short-subunit alcohol dehydrogenase family)